MHTAHDIKARVNSEEDICRIWSKGYVHIRTAEQKNVVKFSSYRRQCSSEQIEFSSIYLMGNNDANTTQM